MAYVICHGSFDVTKRTFVRRPRFRLSLGIHGWRIPIPFEASPGTVDADKLRCIREFGVDRISMGVQSLSARDIAALGRPQKQSAVYRAIDSIRELDFETLNLDRIYGADGQSLDSWIDSVEEAARLRPEEIYLYPLYVRPLTGLAKIHKGPSDLRPAMYRAARQRLLAAGYQ